MYTMYLKGTNDIGLEEKKLQIQYFLTEDVQHISNYTKKVYGIEVINKISNSKDISYEVEKVLKISYSKLLVEKILTKLIEYMVTPVCLIELIDEIMTDELIEEMSS